MFNYEVIFKSKIFINVFIVLVFISSYFIGDYIISTNNDDFKYLPNGVIGLFMMKFLTGLLPSLFLYFIILFVFAIFLSL